MVVAVDRGLLPGAGREVLVAGAEVDRGGERGVVDVLRVPLSVAVTVPQGASPLATSQVASGLNPGRLLISFIKRKQPDLLPKLGKTIEST